MTGIGSGGTEAVSGISPPDPPAVLVRAGGTAWQMHKD